MTQSVVSRVLLAAIAAVLAVLLLARCGLIALPRVGVFGLVLVLLVLPSLFWWLRVDARLAATGGRRVRAVWGVYIAAMLLPLGVALAGGRGWWDRLPVPAIVWLMLWYLAAVALACLSIVGGTILAPRWLWRAAAGRGRRPAGSACAAQTKQTVPGGSLIDRRAVLARAAAAGPLLVVGAGLAAATHQSGRFVIRRLRLRLERCPDRLKGLTITHLSDLHVGRLFRPEHLPALVEAANRLDSDLVVVTGDLVDHSIDFLPAAAEALAQLTHRHGRFLVAGNHDLIDSPHRFIARMRQREAGFLCDERVALTIGGEGVQVAGLLWSHADRSDGRTVGHEERVDSALAGAEPGVFTIGLAHHPHAFDALAARGVDLTLAGHTHGGQFSLPIPGTGRSISAGSLLFRYIRGVYRRAGRVLFVTSGVGNWFPLRLHAPAEIVQIQIV